LEAETAGRREQLRLLSAFAGLAFLLAGVGIHGVLSFAVGQRTAEIGVRMALGARPGDILTMILRQGLMLSGVGVAIGLAAAFLAAQWMDRLLVGVKPHDPVVFGAAAMLCVAASLLAAMLPARRAAHVDPLLVIRAE
jgi:putative ABC transport system permease protein